MNLDYRFEARLTEFVEIGPVNGGVRIDNYFDDRMTDGELAGARVRGVDQIRIREDGSAALDVRETIGPPDNPAARRARLWARCSRRRQPSRHAEQCSTG